MTKLIWFINGFLVVLLLLTISYVTYSSIANSQEYNKYDEILYNQVEEIEDKLNEVETTIDINKAVKSNSFNMLEYELFKD